MLRFGFAIVVSWPRAAFRARRDLWVLIYFGYHADVPLMHKGTVCLVVHLRVCAIVGGAHPRATHGCRRGRPTDARRVGAAGPGGGGPVVRLRWRRQRQPLLPVEAPLPHSPFGSGELLAHVQGLDLREG